MTTITDGATTGKATTRGETTGGDDPHPTTTPASNSENEDEDGDGDGDSSQEEEEEEEEEEKGDAGNDNMEGANGIAPGAKQRR